MISRAVKLQAQKCVITRKLSYRKDDRAMRPIYGCPENFRESLTDYAHSYFSRNFEWAFVRMDPVNVPAKFEIRSFAISRDNRSSQKIGA